MSGPNPVPNTRASSAESAGLDWVVPARERAEPPALPASAWSNVVPFVRVRAEVPPTDSAPALVVTANDRPAPEPGARDRRAWIVAIFALSLMVHGGLFFLTDREPEPMASVGLEAISVEIVLGANTPAGAASTPSQQETQAAPADTPAEPDKPEVAEQPPPEPPAETKPEREPEPEVTPPQETAAAPPEQTPPPPETVTAPEPPPEPPPVAEAPPEPVPPPEPPKPEFQPEPPKPEVKPEPPKPEIKPEPPKVEVKRPPKPAPKPAPKPEPKREAKAKPAPKRAAAPAPRASAASGIGAGRSSNDANYRGRVSAHLARYKRFPPEAQGSGAHGSATVTFALDGGGRVTRVSLVRGTGVPALDREAVAMVHRASPFPAPPDHRPVSFTVPVSYRTR